MSRTTPAQQRLLDRYVQAWERLDVDRLVAVLKDDAVYTMPPMSEWYAGREAIRAFFEWAWKAYDGYRLVATAANGQPAFAAYSRRHADEPWAAHSIHVLAIEHDLLSAMTVFVNRAGSRLFPAFGLPLVLPEGAGAGSSVLGPGRG